MVHAELGKVHSLWAHLREIVFVLASVRGDIAVMKFLMKRYFLKVVPHLVQVNFDLGLHLALILIV